MVRLMLEYDSREAAYRISDRFKSGRVRIGDDDRPGAFDIPVYVRYGQTAVLKYS